MKYATASFGITALNELQQLHNGKSLVEDGEFAIEVMEYINKKVKEFKAKLNEEPYKIKKVTHNFIPFSNIERR